MAIIYVLVLIFIASIVISAFKFGTGSYSDGIIDWFMGGLFGLMFGCIPAGLLALFVCLLCYGPSWISFDAYNKLAYRVNLANLESDTASQGHFFLGSGGFGENAKYYYYSEVNGVYTPHQIAITGVQIKYIDSGQRPYIEKYKAQFNSGLVQWAIGSFIEGAYVPPTKYVIHVPKGSIKSNYDMEFTK